MNISANASASLKPSQTWDAWHTFLTEKHGLSLEPAFVGMRLRKYQVLSLPIQASPGNGRKTKSDCDAARPLVTTDLWDVVF